MNTARRAGATSLAALASCVIAFVALQPIEPRWACSAGLDFWALADYQDAQQGENERREKLEADADDLAQRIAAVDTVVDAVIENRLGFAEAVERCIEIYTGRAGFIVALKITFYDYSDIRDLHARYLRMKIECKLEEYPSHLADVMARIK